MPMMKTFSLALALSLLALPASAACFADYKAKKDGPLRLHYGIVELDENRCSKEKTAPAVAERIAVDGWQLLAVISVFDKDGLEQRKTSAGDYFLRY